MRVINKFDMICVLVLNSYYTSAEYIRILTDPDKASKGSGALQSNTVCRLIDSVCPSRYILTDAFAGLVAGEQGTCAVRNLQIQFYINLPAASDNDHV